MRHRIKSRHPSSHQAFSLSELLVVIAVIAIITMIAIPILRGLDRVSTSKAKRNAQLTAEVSSNLTSLDVAHVLPESLGGAEATTRLLQTGISIEDGPMQGTYMGIPNLPSKDVEETAKFLNVVFDLDGLRLEYKTVEEEE